MTGPINDSRQSTIKHPCRTERPRKRTSTPTLTTSTGQAQGVSPPTKIQRTVLTLGPILVGSAGAPMMASLWQIDALHETPLPLLIVFPLVL